MIIIPAIDLLNGGCVRLSQGDYGEAVFYNELDPVSRARQFEAAGVRRIHIVDLDAARGGGNNRGVIRALARETNCLIEVGGGLRTERDVEELLDAGADRLILGTLLAREPDKARRLMARYGKKFIAGIDARGGEVRVSGWREAGGFDDISLAKLAADAGAVSIIYTNIARDGMMSGPDFERTFAVAQAAGIPVILSGGVSSLEDIREAARLSSLSSERGRMCAVITGKAVYEGKINLEALVREFPQDMADDDVW
jgi:phosphoribosylformimino-5-aminoimidazole carboxamide ribotide isomerase